MPLKSLQLLSMASLLLAVCTGCGEQRRRRDVIVIHDPAPAGQPGEIIITEAPPPERVEHLTPAPSMDHVWIAGYWQRVGHEWVWVAGHWERRHHPGAEWAPGHWAATTHGWAWRPGHWR